MSAASTYRKKPVEVEAMQTDGTLDTANRIIDWAGRDVYAARFNPGRGTCDEMTVRTKHGGCERLDPGDWVIREPDGSGFYPCAAADFAATYERASDCPKDGKR